MFIKVFSTLILFSEAAKPGGFMEFYNSYLNIPGFEAWKFLNLAIFVAILTYLARKPLGSAFKAKRELIRADLIKAEEEKKSALAKLTTTESRLASIDNETQLVLLKAKEEADVESGRITREADAEAAKLGSQTDGEIERLVKILNVELKKFSANESIRLAETKLRGRIDDKADADLIKTGIASIGGLK